MKRIISIFFLIAVFLLFNCSNLINNSSTPTPTNDPNPTSAPFNCQQEVTNHGYHYCDVCSNYSICAFDFGGTTCEEACIAIGLECAGAYTVFNIGDCEHVGPYDCAGYQADGHCHCIMPK